MKYNNRKTTVEGIAFDSKREAQRYTELMMLEKAGEITDLELQKRFELVPKQQGERPVVYVADFVYRDSRSGALIVEDTKGCRTKEYIIKRKLMLYRYGIKITET